MIKNIHEGKVVVRGVTPVMHRAGVRFLYGTFSGRGRWQSVGPRNRKRRTDLPANVRNTAVKCGKRVRTVRMKTFASVQSVHVRTNDSGFLKKTGRFGRDCVQNLLTTGDSDGIGGWDRVVNDAHPSDARYFRKLKDSMIDKQNP